MQNLSFTACSFFIRDYHSKCIDKIHYLNDKFPIIKDDSDSTEYRTFEEFLYEFFDCHKDTVAEDKLKKTFSIIYDKANVGENDNFRYYYAQVKSGYFGNISEIINIKTKKIVAKKSIDDADEMTFNIFVVIPKDNKKVKVQKGMLFSTNVGIFGIKAVTTLYFQEFLSKNYNYSINFKGIAPSLFVDKVMTKDAISSIILTKNHKSGNIAESMYQGYGKETRIIKDIKFSDKLWDRTKAQIDYFRKGKYFLYEFENTKYEGAKVEVEIGGRKRVINLNNLENMSIIENLPSSLRLNDGTFDEKKLISYLTDSAEEYLKHMVLSIK